MYAHRLSIVLSTALALLVLVAMMQGVRAAEDQLDLELSEGQLVRLSRAADSVFIANPEIADVSVKSPRLIYVFGKRPGQTTLYAVDSNEQVITRQDVTVSHDLSRLQGELGRLLPTAGIKASSVEGGIVLTGAVGDPVHSEDARRLAKRFVGPDGDIINRIAVLAPNQVNLRVRVAEVSREVVGELGFNWEAAFDGIFSLGIATGNPVIGAAGFLTRLNDGGDLFGGGSGSNFDINALIDALDDDNLITVLAEPNLTAMTGQTASFLAGGEFPIPVDRDNDGITIEFKEFGVSLAFTPTVLSPNRISLNVRPEVSQLSQTDSIELGDLVIPSLIVRRAETTVELASGQSFAIAGLLLDRSVHDTSTFPGLGHIPILGRLFQSERFQKDETELVIIVTPYLVKPVDARQLAAPTDGFTTTTQVRQPNPVEQGGISGPMVFNQTDQTAGNAPVGFILE